MSYSTRKFVIGPDDAGRRLDRIVRSLLAEMPLSMVYRLFRDGAVRISGKKVDGSYRTVAGDTVEIRLADLPENEASRPGRGSAVEAGAASRSDAARLFAGMIIVETADLAVVNKPRGVLTHGGGGVDEAAAAYYAERMAASLAFTPAPLHRLDRNTSGALAVSASLAGATSFSEALRRGLVEKAYLALLGGDMPEEQEWVDRMERDGDSRTSSTGDSGDLAIARAIPLLRRDGLTLALVRLGTGRTHQIRAQAAARSLALAGDAKYGGSPLPGGYLLHCALLATPAGVGGPGGLRVEAPLPRDAERTIVRIFGDDWTNRSLNTGIGLINTGGGGTLKDGKEVPWQKET